MVLAGSDSPHRIAVRQIKAASLKNGKEEENGKSN